MMIFTVQRVLSSDGLSFGKAKRSEKQNEEGFNENERFGRQKEGEKNAEPEGKNGDPEMTASVSRR